MNIAVFRRLSFLFALLCVAAIGTHASAAAPAAARSAAAPSAAAPPAASAAAPAAAPSAGDSPAAQDEFNDDSDSDNHDRSEWRNHAQWRSRHRRHGEDGDMVNIGHSSHLPSGQRANSVVSILGSSTSEGDADDVVSILGNTRVTGKVSDSAVAVIGNTYVDSKVDGDVVAVLGNVELGPNAEVGGDVVSILGVVNRDPASIVHGAVQRVFSFDVGGVTGIGWLNTWVKACLLEARPLGLVPGLGWAWTLALIFLAFYAFLAVLFRGGIDRCVQTLESQPGHTVLAALIATLLTPVLIVLLCVTLIGIAAVPFVVIALFCAGLFGKAVMLAWLGGRVTGRRPGPAGHPAVAVLVGGAIVLVLYVVPVLGFLVYKLLGFFGFGAVVYTLILMARARRAANGTAGPAASAPPGSAPADGIPLGAAPAAAAASASAAAASAGAAPGGAAPDLRASAQHASTYYSAALPRAGFWIRMAALLLDVLLVGFVTSLGGHMFGHFPLVILAIYGAVMWKMRGATVGGIVFDLHVVRLDGRPVDWETAIVRALGCFLSLAVVFLGFIWIAFDDNRQGWHDKIAGTVVVRVKKAAPLV
jgi:uncharacterized RDD family membrane protein YckC